MKRLSWNESRWGVMVKCSDYDSLTTISRIAGNPDLEYMLRLNQIMINFVKDKQRDEYVLLLIFYVNTPNTVILTLVSVYTLCLG